MRIGMPVFACIQLYVTVSIDLCVSTCASESISMWATAVHVYLYVNPCLHTYACLIICVHVSVYEHTPHQYQHVY